MDARRPILPPARQLVRRKPEHLLAAVGKKIHARHQVVFPDAGVHAIDREPPAVLALPQGQLGPLARRDVRHQALHVKQLPVRIPDGADVFRDPEGGSVRPQDLGLKVRHVVPLRLEEGEEFLPPRRRHITCGQLPRRDRHQLLRTLVTEHPRHRGIRQAEPTGGRILINTLHRVLKQPAELGLRGAQLECPAMEQVPQIQDQRHDRRHRQQIHPELQPDRSPFPRTRRVHRQCRAGRSQNRPEMGNWDHQVLHAGAKKVGRQPSDTAEFLSRDNPSRRLTFRHQTPP